jgi:hypothetical protein
MRSTVDKAIRRTRYLALTLLGLKSGLILVFRDRDRSRVRVRVRARVRVRVTNSYELYDKVYVLTKIKQSE